MIAVPTPLTENREPDLGPLVGAATSLAGVLQQGQLVVLESTTYPGTTRERLVPLLEESGLAAGQDFHVAFSPERIDPGRTDWTLRNTPKVVGGLTDACRDRAVAFYSQVCDEIVPVSAPEEAELTKLLENVFRSVNIALVNELAILCDRMGIDVWEVVEAANTKPYGFMSFRPGPGMGGHCLPVDPFYLAWKAREYDMPTAFVELAGEVNQKMPYFCVERVAHALNDHAKPVRGSRVAIMGVSYKPGVGDLRESPALKIMRLLAEDGADLVYHDETVPELSDFGLRSQPLEAALDGADVRGDRHRPPGPRYRPDPAPKRRWWSTSAASPAGAKRRTSCACERRSAGRGRRPRLLGPEPRPQLRPPAGSGPALGLRRLRRAPRARGGEPARAPAPPPTWTRCWPTRRSTRWCWPPTCPPTPTWPCGCWGRASTASWRSRWPSRPPTPSAWSRPPRPRAGC